MGCGSSKPTGEGPAAPTSKQPGPATSTTSAPQAPAAQPPPPAPAVSKAQLTAPSPAPEPPPAPVAQQQKEEPPVKAPTPPAAPQAGALESAGAPESPSAVGVPAPKAETLADLERKEAAGAAMATGPVFPDVPIEEGSLPDDAMAVVLLGGPGSGKGTLAEKLVAKYGLHHLSSGDLLRAEVASGSELGKVCAQVMEQGGLVPDIVGCNMLKNAMIRSGKRAFLLDGFPRSMGQATTFEAEVIPFDFCVYLECSEEVMKERLLGRGKTSGRADDNEETIMKRFNTFQTETTPVTNFFMTASKMFKISGEQSPAEVFEATVNEVGEKLEEKLGTTTEAPSLTEDAKPAGECLDNEVATSPTNGEGSTHEEPKEDQGDGAPASLDENREEEST